MTVKAGWSLTLGLTIRDQSTDPERHGDDDEGSGFVLWIVVTLIVIVVLFLITQNMLDKDTEFKEKELGSAREAVKDKKLEKLKREEQGDGEKSGDEKGQENENDKDKKTEHDK